MYFFFLVCRLFPLLSGVLLSVSFFNDFIQHFQTVISCCQFGFGGNMKTKKNGQCQYGVHKDNHIP